MIKITVEWDSTDKITQSIPKYRNQRFYITSHEASPLALYQLFERVLFDMFGIGRKQQ